jgi:Ca2+-binding RTX toxin-like protein
VETTLLGAGGHDVVGLRIASGTYTLAANVEDLYMIGAASINAIGTAAGNYMRGNNGANVLKGMAGGDNLDGGKGDDVLHGGNGKDMLHGGGGADAFVFGVTDTSIAATNADLINDFKSTIDHIDFDNALFTQIGSTNFGASDARFYAAAGAKAGHDTNDRIIYDTASGKLYYDADGSNAGAVVLVATLQGHPTVAATDIHVI